MAITNGYATLAEFKTWPDITSTDATDDGMIEDLIESASRFIDNQTGRTFYARTETRYYDVPSGRELQLDDDLLAITTLTNGDDTTLAATEYHLIPKNVTPYYAIRLKSTSAYMWQSDSSGGREYVISVAGTWGWTATCPAEIKTACLQIATDYYNKTIGSPGASTAQVTAMGVVLTPAGVPATAMQLINRYKKRT